MTTFLHRATCWLGLLLLGGSPLAWSRPGPGAGPVLARALTVRLGPGTEAAPRLAFTNDDHDLLTPGGTAAAPVAAGAEAAAPATLARATAGNINKLEYFIDADPGYGSGVNVPVTAGANVANVSFSISLSAVSYGFHRLTTRSRDVGGVWSISNTTSFYYQAPAASGASLANINKVEYFIDADPGLGSGINVPVATPATTVSGLAFAVNLTPIGYGFHRLSTRSRDVNGKWSLTNTASFYYQAPTTSTTLANINKVEYFIDTDPGFGSGINVPVATPATTLSGLAFAVNLTPVGYGFHRLYTRSRDVNGVWSLTNAVPFYYQRPTTSTTLANINKVEYFIDTDPGFGSGINVPVATPATTISGLAFAVNLVPVGYGFHRLYTRSRDVNGVWSITNTEPFYYQRPANSTTLANINKIEYFIDADPGIGNGINVPVTTPATTVSGVPFVASLSGVSFGFHRLTTRTRDVNGVWSISNTNSFYYQDLVAPTVPVPNITRVEYFFDTDPGFGSATSVPIATPAADLPNVAFAANASVLTDGPHLLSTRSRDANGKWSLVNHRAIGKNGCASSLNFAAGLPTTPTNSYTASGSYGNSPALAFNTVPTPAPLTTSNSPYFYTGAYLQVDLGSAQTINGIGATFTSGSNTSLTLLVQTATAVAGTYTTVDTYTTTFTAGVAYPVVRTLATPAMGVRAVRLLFQNVSSNYVIVGGEGIYNFVCAIPTLTSAAPTSGAVGSTLTLNGTNLAGTSTVTFSGASGNTVTSGYTVNAAGTQITGIVVPAGAVSGSITITSPNGTSNSTPFAVLPALASISPTSGPTGTVVTLTGTTLTGATTITFSGSSNNTVASGSFTVNAAGTQISNITVPTGATTGNVTVTNASGTSNGVVFTITSAQLAVSQSGTSYPSGGTAYNFGNQAQSTSSSAVTFTLANAGAATLTISNITTTGNFATSGGTPTSVAAGGTGTVNVVFTPTATGPRTGTLVITSNAGTYTVNLSGTGTTAPPSISSLNPTSGVVGSSVTITGTNLSGATSVSFNGTTVASAAFTSNSATSIVLNVPTGATTGLVTVTTAGGTSSGVTFTVTAAQLAVSQSGTSYPSSGTAYNFGNQVQNTSSSAVAFTLTNAGTAPLTISNITTSGNFATSGTLPSSIAAGGTAPVSVVFTPASTGPRTGSLIITSSLGTYTVNLSGNGVVAPPSISNLNPTSGPVGTSVTITGTDLGSASSVSFNGTVASNATFTSNTATSLVLPVPSGATTGLVTVTTAGGTSSGLTFTVTVPQLAVSQSGTAYPSGGTAYSFGSQVQNTSSSAVAFTLTNAGTAPLTISSISTTGNFATSGGTPTSVAAGGTSSVSVVFTPTTTGTRTGTLVITSSLGTYTVNLTGTGTTAPPSISSLNPTSGPVGTSVTITGTALSGATSVSFNGTTVASASFTSSSATSIVLNVPTGATTGNVTVTTPGGTSNGVAFTVTVVPAITGFTPLSGLAGTSVTITGTNLATVTGVRFGTGMLTTNFVSQSATSLTVRVPVVSSTGPITLTNSAGATAVSSGTFTYVARQSLTATLSPAGPLDVCQPRTLTASAASPAFATGTGFDGPVRAVTVQTDGKVLVGGNFSSYNGTAGQNDLVRLNADGTLDAGFATGTGFNGFVFSVAVQTDGKVLVGGSFSSYNGTAGQNDLVRLNADGTLDASFATGTGFLGFNNSVYSVAIQADGKVLAGGGFTTYNGTAASCLVRLNANGSRDAAFVTGTGFNGNVQSVAVQADGKVLAGGDFDRYNGITGQNGLLRLNTDGTLDAGFATGTGFPGSVYSVAVQADGKVLAGGAFGTYNGTAASGLVRLNAAGNRDAGFVTGTDFNSTVSNVVVQADSKVLVSGGFTTYNGVTASSLVRLNADGSRDAAFVTGTGFNTLAYVYSVAVQADGKMLAGGDFISYNGTVQNRLVRLNADGSLNTTATAVSGASFTFSPGNTTTNPLVTSTAGSYTATASLNGETSGASNTVVLTACSMPTLTSLNPTSGLVGTSVTLTGTNFGGATSVSFNGTTVTSASFTSASATSIVLNVPSGATTGNVTVTTPAGTSNGVTFTVTAAQLAVSQSGTSYPSGGAAYSFGSQVQNTGSSAVAFTLTNGGTATLTISSISTTGDFATSGGTPTSVAAGGTSSVSVVFTPTATGPRTGTLVITSSAGTYTVNLSGTGLTPAPVLTSLNPTSGVVGASVVISGSNLNGASGVSFNGTAASGYTVNGTGTQLTVNVPSGASTGNVTVTTPGGTSNGLTFTVTAPQLAVSQSGTAYPSGGTAYSFGNQVQNTSSSAVAFTLTNAGTAALTISSITTTGNFATSGTLPSSVAAGGSSPVSVVFTPTTTGPRTGTLVIVSSLGTYTVNLSGTGIVAPPTLTSLNPTSGPVGTSVTITGSNLGSASSVSFNGTTVASASFTSNSATSLVLNVPTGATTGPVTVTTAGGTSSGLTFTVTVVYPDLTISTGSLGSPVAVAPGNYNSITVTGSGIAQLTGGTVVNSSVSVSGTLLSSCQALTGAATFTLAAGATLGICDVAGLSSTPSTGAVQTTGTRSFSSDASYVYNGTQAQATGNALPPQVRNLTTTNNQVVTLTQAVAVVQTLTIGGTGNLALNSQALTLLSSASGTALAVNSGTGVVTGGTATMQRYLSTTNLGLGYRHYSAPVSGSTVNDLTTASFTPRVNTAYNTAAAPNNVNPFPTVFHYDQSRLATVTSNYGAFDKGWESPAALTSLLAVGQGYSVNLRGTEKVDFTGTLNTGDYPVPLARNAGTTAADAGWALVGNPYPAPITWANVLPADRPGLDGAMYVFESNSPYSGQYRTNVNNMGTSDLIGSSQAFFVRVSTGQTSGSLTFHNSQRLTNYGQQVAVRRGTADPRPQVQLRLGGAGLSDDLFVYAEAGATAGLDAQFDATKLANPSGLGLAAVAATGQALAIQGLPVLTAATVVPLTVQVPAAGTYTFTAPALLNLPASTQVFLTDALTGQRVNLQTLLATSYAVTLTAAQAATPVAGRFFLNLVPAAAPLATAAQALEAGLRLYPNPAHGVTTVWLPAVPGATRATLELYDALGRTISQQTLALAAMNTTTVLDLTGLASGVYVLRVQAGAAQTTRRVVVN